MSKFDKPILGLGSDSPSSITVLAKKIVYGDFVILANPDQCWTDQCKRINILTAMANADLFCDFIIKY